MARITWENRADSGSASQISASIFNEIKESVNAIYDDDVSISGSLNISGSIIPNVADGVETSSFDLGSETAAWRDLYVSTGSIKFVGPGGSISSMSKQDIDNIKGGKPIPSTPKTLTRDGASITVNTYNETDALVSPHRS